MPQSRTTVIGVEVTDCLCTFITPSTSAECAMPRLKSESMLSGEYDSSIEQAMEIPSGASGEDRELARD